MKFTSKWLKLRLLEYYRFKRSMLVGTEINGADVLAITMDLKRGYEIETKISISDLKADFKYKETKHLRMEKTSPYFMTPNYFIFAFPTSIIDKAVQYLETKNDKYGIISVDEKGLITTVKRPKILNKSNNSQLKHYLDLRLNNELITCLQTIENNFIKKPIDI